MCQLGRSLARVGVGAWCDRGLSAPSFCSLLSLFSLAARWARWWRELAAVAALRDWKPAAAHVTGKIVVAWTGRGTALVSCDLHEPGAFRLPTPILLFACAMAMAGRGGLFVYCCRATGWAETVRSQLHRALGGHYTRALWLSSLVHLPIPLPFLSRSALPGTHERSYIPAMPADPFHNHARPTAHLDYGSCPKRAMIQTHAHQLALERRPDSWQFGRERMGSRVARRCSRHRSPPPQLRSTRRWVLIEPAHLSPLSAARAWRHGERLRRLEHHLVDDVALPNSCATRGNALLHL
jgi:hypothetical protein